MVTTTGDSRGGGCGRPRTTATIAACAVCVVTLSAGAQIEGDSGTLDLLYYVRSGATPGVLGGVVGMLVRLGEHPASRRSWLRSVLSGWVVAIGVCAAGTARGWTSGWLMGGMILGGLISEPLVQWLLTRTGLLLDRAADRALPPEPPGGIAP